MIWCVFLLRIPKLFLIELAFLRTSKDKLFNYINSLYRYIERWEKEFKATMTKRIKFLYQPISGRCPLYFRKNLLFNLKYMFRLRRHRQCGKTRRKTYAKRHGLEFKSYQIRRFRTGLATAS